MLNDVRDVLQKFAVDQGRSVLDVNDTRQEITRRFGASVNVMSWGEMFMMDMMYFKCGGNYRLFEYNYPEVGDVVNVDGVARVVTDTSLFTFAAEEVQDFDEESDE